MGEKSSKLKPQAVVDLMRMTDFNDQELIKWYQEFREKTSSRYLRKEDFISMFAEYFPDSDVTAFADHVFRTYDVNKDGLLNFREMVVGLSLTAKGKFEDKLYWAFNLYDVDGNGYISKNEMGEIIKAMHAICRDCGYNDICQNAFHKLDTNQDGKVSWAEFRKGLQENKELLEIIQKTISREN